MDAGNPGSLQEAGGLEREGSLFMRADRPKNYLKKSIIMKTLSISAFPFISCARCVGVISIRQ